MLDLNLIRENPDFVREKLAIKGCSVDFSSLLEQDATRRSLIYQVEQLKAERNKTSAEIPKLKKQGKDTESILARMKAVSDEIKVLDARITELAAEQQAFLEALPNLPADGVPPGGKENNEVVKVVGKKPTFDFEPKHHVDLVESTGMIDYVRGVKLGGNGFWLYRRDGARLEWALLNYFLDRHHADGYELILPPHILNWQCGYTAGQFPKFADDVYQLRAAEEADAPHGFTHFILPTAETALVNVHRDEILNEADLPLKYAAFTPCYRREAGSYRAEERGMIRGHQFNKVEIFQYALPEQSSAGLKELIDKAAALVEGLGLHFQVSRLAAEDCSASMCETYDVEIWIPSMDGYKEVSSASNAGDYQARRGNIRFRREATGKPEFVHTLNASGLATSRIMPAIVEQNQQADGSILIPEVLRPWMGGQERILPL